ncbi:MAG: DUF6359 domain-containing protein [Bacteroidaceae bacterium]|nr:DUF6359 domain-containing protein [Bacteroidaceae bacterium]
MKRLFKKLLPAVVAIGFLTACEDVPAPYYLLQKIIDSSVILDESFANSLGKFTVYNETDDGYEWANQYNTAYISGYQNNVNKATKSWLISPAFDLSNAEQAYVMFEYVLRFKRSTTKERILVSANYADQISSGVHGTPATATWYDLNIDLPETADYKNFNSVGAQLPPEVLGQKRVHIAFYYEAPATEASTWEVKNLIVKEGQYDDPNKEEPEEGVYLYEKFASSLGEFTPFTELAEGYNWSNQYSSAYISGYQNKENKATKAWLVSPAVDLTASKGAFVSFQYVYMYQRQTCQERVYITNNYTGDPTTTRWTDLNMEMKVTPSYSSFYTIGTNLPEAFIGEGNSEVVFALFYEAPDNEASTWEVKEFKVKEGEYTEQEDEPIEGLNGSGTAEDPYDVASALKLIKENKIPSHEVYVKGQITSLGDATGKDMPGNTFGNATYFISDLDEAGAPTGEALEVYRGYGLGGEKITSNYIKVGDNVIVVGTLVYYNNKTPEFTQGSKIYSLNGETAGGGGGGEEFGTPAGSGTKEDPYNVAATVQLIDGLGSATSDYIYTKGIITSLGDPTGKDMPGNSFGNATYFISDMDASGKPTGGSLEVFRGYGLGGAEVTSDYIKVGDVVVVYGKVKLYNGKTREFDQGSVLYSLNGETLPDVPEAEPKGSGTLDDPYNAAKANQVAKALPKDGKSDVVYIAGKVATIKSNGNYDAKNTSGQYYGNATFFISDDGSTNNTFQVYQALYLGNKKYDGNGDLLKQGDDVIICGKLTNYLGTTPETAKGEAYLYSLNGNTGEQDPPTPPVEVGTYDNPWTVTDAQANYIDGTPQKSYVVGYIVGYVKGSKYQEGALFGADALEQASAGTSAPTNILIGLTPNSSSTDECIPMALPTGEFRTGLNLKDHPEVMGSQILIYGSVEKYFQVAGLKSPTYVEYTVSDATGGATTKTIGTRPDAAKKRFTKRLR